MSQIDISNFENSTRRRVIAAIYSYSSIVVVPLQDFSICWTERSILFSKFNTSYYYIVYSYSSIVLYNISSIINRIK
jgi:hypothetical protein